MDGVPGLGGSVIILISFDYLVNETEITGRTGVGRVLCTGEEFPAKYFFVSLLLLYFFCSCLILRCRKP